MVSMGVRVVTHAGAGAFLKRAEPWLLEHEAEYNLVLGIAMAESVSERPSPDVFFATVEDAGEVVGAAFRTPPHKLAVTRMPLGAVPLLMEAVSLRYDAIPAVLGPKDVAEAAAEEWTRLRGGRWTPGMRQRIYRLDLVTPPLPTAGAARLAHPDELELIRDWMEGFAAETSPDFGVSTEVIQGWIDAEELFVWDHLGPVSVARPGGGTPNGMRVGYVYTPSAHRRRGYAAALVASVSQEVLDRGFSFCVLYTDLSNPTSNSIYQKIGYVPLVDTVDADIEPADGELGET